MQRAADALLLNARTLDHITVDTLVRSYGFTPGEAQARLDQEQRRRARG
jgi:hypothetical protein